MPFTARVDEEVPVLIVGGGGAGVTASTLLAREGVERHAKRVMTAHPVSSQSDGWRSLTPKQVAFVRC